MNPNIYLPLYLVGVGVWFAFFALYAGTQSDFMHRIDVARSVRRSARLALAAPFWPAALVVLLGVALRWLVDQAVGREAKP